MSSASSLGTGNAVSLRPATPGRRGLARLRHERDIQRVFRAGTSAHSRYLSVHCLDRDDRVGLTRTTVVAGRKAGSAVQRNRAKRRLRAALREVTVPEGFDVIVVARPRTAGVPFTELQSVLSERLRMCARHARASG